MAQKRRTSKNVRNNKQKVEKECVNVLSEAEQFYLLKHIDLMTVEELAKKINTNIITVQHYVDNIKKEEENKVKQKDDPNKPAPVPFAAPIIREDGIAICTEASSQYADEFIRESSKPNYVEKNTDRIFKMHPNKPTK